MAPVMVSSLCPSVRTVSGEERENRLVPEVICTRCWFRQSLPQAARCVRCGAALVLASPEPAGGPSPPTMQGAAASTAAGAALPPGVAAAVVLPTEGTWATWTNAVRLLTGVKLVNLALAMAVLGSMRPLPSPISELPAFLSPAGRASDSIAYPLLIVVILALGCVAIWMMESVVIRIALLCVAALLLVPVSGATSLTGGGGAGAAVVTADVLSDITLILCLAVSLVRSARTTA